METSLLLLLPPELRALILSYVIIEEIPFDQPDVSLCEIADHRHIYEPAFLFSPCLGLCPSCHSPYTLLFINEQLRTETFARIKHICLDYPWSLSHLLPHLESFFQQTPNAQLPFRLTIRNFNSTHLWVLETILSECERAPQNRDLLLRRVLDSPGEWQILQIARDHQLYPTFGSIELNPNYQPHPRLFEHVMLEGFLPFTLSHDFTLSPTQSTQESETAFDETNAASGMEDVFGKPRIHALNDRPWDDINWHDMSNPDDWTSAT